MAKKITRATSIPPQGPADANVYILSHYPGTQESLLNSHFSGHASYMLKNFLGQADIDLAECRVASVFPDVSTVSLENLFVPKTDPLATTELPQLNSRYLPSTHRDQLTATLDDITATKPTVILALGPLPLWALTGESKLTSSRGTVFSTPYGKVLPTYHPNIVHKQYSLNPIVSQDMLKLGREKTSPDISRPARTIYYEPTLKDVEQYFAKLLIMPKGFRLSLDVETRLGQITCLSISPSSSQSFVIPFWTSQPNYWTEEEEIYVWKLLRDLINGPHFEFIFQNGLYDVQYLALYGIYPPAIHHDTMLLHHAMFPELPKGLGFLGSVYTNEASWKSMAKDQWKDK